LHIDVLVLRPGLLDDLRVTDGGAAEMVDDPLSDAARC
jgi:hypothetical protein